MRKREHISLILALLFSQAAVSQGAEETVWVCDRGFIGNLITSHTDSESCKAVSAEKMRNLKYLSTKGYLAPVTNFEIRKGDLAGLESLELLMLVGHAPDRIDPKAFDDTPKFQSLTIRNSSASFDLCSLNHASLARLEQLDVSYSRFPSPKCELTELKKLKNLNLSRNRIGEVPPGFLRGLESLEVLTWDSALDPDPNDKGIEITADFFKHNPRLKYFSANYGKFKSIHKDAFKHTPLIEGISLGYFYDVNAFKGLPALKWLRLSSSFPSFPDLEGTTNLEELVVLSHRDQELPESYKKLHKLKTLLIYNEGRNIFGDYRSFCGLKSLKKLYIDTRKGFNFDLSCLPGLEVIVRNE